MKLLSLKSPKQCTKDALNVKEPRLKRYPFASIIDKSCEVVSKVLRCGFSYSSFD
jgi:hypothetical protein